MVLKRALLVLATGGAGCLNPSSVGAFADSCGSCHTAQQAALEASAHGPDRTPLFSMLRSATDSPVCDSCHSPAPEPHSGLDCTTCHAAVGNAGEGGGQVVLDWNGPVRGPTGASGGPHDTEQSAFLTSSALCGTCHEVAGPPGFVETTFSEWQTSPAARMGVGCVDCHFQDHALRGLQSEGAALIAETLQLTATADSVSLTNTNPAHAVPAGAAWSRLLQLEFDTGETIVFSPELSHLGTPVASPLDATMVEFRSLEAETSRSWRWPSGATRAELVYFSVAPALGRSSRTAIARVHRESGSPRRPETHRGVQSE